MLLDYDENFRLLNNDAFELDLKAGDLCKHNYIYWTQLSFLELEDIKSGKSNTLANNHSANKSSWMGLNLSPPKGHVPEKCKSPDYQLFDMSSRPACWEYYTFVSHRLTGGDSGHAGPFAGDDLSRNGLEKLFETTLTFLGVAVSTYDVADGSTIEGLRHPLREMDSGLGCLFKNMKDVRKHVFDGKEHRAGTMELFRKSSKPLYAVFLSNASGRIISREYGSVVSDTITRSSTFLIQRK